MAACRGLAVALALAFMTTPAAAEFVASHGDWNVFAETRDGKKSCYMASQPKKAEGRYTKRGDTYVMIEHSQSADVVGLVSIEAGYPYNENSKVKVEIDGEAYEFYTHPDTPEVAWTHDDQVVVAAMRKGARMIVRGTSRRHTLTTDTYSLKGVTAAYQAISKLCGVT